MRKESWSPAVRMDFVAQTHGRFPRESNRLPSSRIEWSCAGNPAAYLTRLNRSSSTAATSRPPQTIAADALPWYALIPKMFIA